MRRKAGILIVLAALILPMISSAIDRDTRMIDTISVKYSNFARLDIISLNLWVENLLAAPSESWAIVAGGSIGNAWPVAADDLITWDLGLGIKYYLTHRTGITLLADYRKFDGRDDSVIVSGKLHLKQRFRSSWEHVSPFVTVSGSIDEAEFEKGFLSVSEDKDFTAFVVTAGIGIDFLMSDDFAFVFFAEYSESEDSNDGVDYADGWSASFAMQYYWD